MRHFAILTLGLTASLLQAADPALLNLVMPDAKVLMGINVQKAKTTQFGQFLLSQIPAGSDMNGFVTATGFDPRQDLIELLVASSGAPKAGALILARGNFNPTQITAAVSTDGKHTTQTYKGAQLITPKSATDKSVFAFLSGSVAIVGDIASVKTAIDRSSANNSIDPALAAKVASYAATDAWTVSIGPISIPGSSPDSANNPLGGALKSIQQASGSILLSTPVEINVEAQADTDQNATALSDVLKFFAAMMVQQGGNTPANLLNSLNVSTDHNIIKLSLSIPEDQLEQLIKGATAPTAPVKPNKM